jgi:hypothetical protein
MSNLKKDVCVGEKEKEEVGKIILEKIISSRRYWCLNTKIQGGGKEEE